MKPVTKGFQERHIIRGFYIYLFVCMHAHVYKMSVQECHCMCEHQRQLAGIASLLLVYGIWPTEAYKQTKTSPLTDTWKYTRREQIRSRKRSIGCYCSNPGNKQYGWTLSEMDPNAKLSDKLWKLVWGMDESSFTSSRLQSGYVYEHWLNRKTTFSVP